MAKWNIRDRAGTFLRWLVTPIGLLWLVTVILAWQLYDLRVWLEEKDRRVALLGNGKIPICDLSSQAERQLDELQSDANKVKDSIDKLDWAVSRIDCSQE